MIRIRANESLVMVKMFHRRLTLHALNYCSSSEYQSKSDTSACFTDTSIALGNSAAPYICKAGRMDGREGCEIKTFSQISKHYPSSMHDQTI